MKRPDEEIDPQFVVQVKEVLAVNCWVEFSFTVTDDGETVTAIRDKQNVN